LRQAQASMAIMLGDLPRAVEHANACVALSRAAGSKSQEASALANLAHITSVAGDVERTQQLLRAAHNLLPPKNYFRFATINTGITIGLASGDEDFAEAMVAQGDALAAAAAEHSYYQLWFILHRVRWLIHRGDFARAADEAGVALASIERLAETELADRMRLLRAEALAGAGRRGTALRDFADATSGAADRTLETLAETQRLAA